MKKICAGLLVVLLVATLAGIVQQAFADPVAAAGLELTCLRTTDDSGYASSTTFYQGDSISYTNSVMYTGATTNTAVQNLTNCVITVVMGSPGDTNVTSTSGSSIVNTSGTWTASMDVPAFNPCYIEVTVSNGASFTYPRYQIRTRAKLGN